MKQPAKTEKNKKEVYQGEFSELREKIHRAAKRAIEKAVKNANKKK